MIFFSVLSTVDGLCTTPSIPETGLFGAQPMHSRGRMIEIKRKRGRGIEVLGIRWEGERPLEPVLHFGEGERPREPGAHSKTNINQFLFACLGRLVQSVKNRVEGQAVFPWHGRICAIRDSSDKRLDFRCVH